MALEIKRKKLVDIDIPIWAEVRHFATLKQLSISDAVQILLKAGLHNHGYKSSVDEQRIVVRSGKSLTRFQPERTSS
jgi:hypothetical protein